jgi:uncharacterized protein (DUF2147 family)
MNMKAIVSLIFVILISGFVNGQNNPDKIAGTYLSPDGKSKMEFYKSGNFYFSKIVWLKEPNNPKTNKPEIDIENPDPAKKNQPILGLVISKNLKYDGKNSWENGTIYDPNTGKTWDVDAILEGSKLKLKGYWKFSFIGKTEIWTKLN